MQRVVCFDDVLLTPQFSDVESRSTIDLSPPGFDTLRVRLTAEHEELVCPVVGSPMDTVMGPQSAALLADLGGFGVLHRYCTVQESVEMFLTASGLTRSGTSVKNIMVAIGATGDYMERTDALFSAGCRAFCVDVAHGHHIHVKNSVTALRKKFDRKIHIMSGNVSTLEAFNDLAEWGVDSVRVGVGGGSMCTTRIRTGHGVPTLQSVLDCARSHHDVLIVADGGVRNSGDAVKALAAGADMVMLGSVLAGHDESPGALVVKDGHKFKKFRGMASREAQLEWRGRSSVVEGESTLVPYKGSMTDTVTDLLEGVRSGLSYSGARSIRELRSRAKFVHITPNSTRENGPHGKTMP